MFPTGQISGKTDWSCFDHMPTSEPITIARGVEYSDWPYWVTCLPMLKSWALWLTASERGMGQDGVVFTGMDAESIIPVYYHLPANWCCVPPGVNGVYISTFSPKALFSPINSPLLLCHSWTKASDWPLFSSSIFSQSSFLYLQIKV